MDDAGARLEPVAGSASGRLALMRSEYLELADWTGRILPPDKRGAMDAKAPPIVRRWACVNRSGRTR